MKPNTLLTLLLFLTSFVSSTAQDTTEEKYALKARPVPTQCESLREGDDPTVTQASQTLASADAAGKIKLLGALAKSCHKKSGEAITLLLQDKEWAVRQAAVEALGQLGDADSIETLIEMVADPDWRVRFSVGFALCAFQKGNATAAALNRLTLVASETAITAEDLRARLHTAIQINQLRDASFSRKPFQYLFSLMEHENPQFRTMLNETMHALKETRNGQYELIGILKQNLNPLFRRKAAYWLGQLKIEKSRWQLKEVAEEDADESVRKAAAEALKLLGPTDEEPPPSTPKPKTVAKSGAAKKAVPAVSKPAGKATPKK